MCPFLHYRLLLFRLLVLLVLSWKQWCWTGWARCSSFQKTSWREQRVRGEESFRSVITGLTNFFDICLMSKVEWDSPVHTGQSSLYLPTSSFGYSYVSLLPITILLWCSAILFVYSNGSDWEWWLNRKRCSFRAKPYNITRKDQTNLSWMLNCLLL